ncbi:hypothetical protein QCA50_014799 [Cerrena zonata]|uniref:Uncharacterized protein n=1 Tax=Cerrena zonata TaxID=2478898 RepID=A0AAW0FY28_9APHY
MLRSSILFSVFGLDALVFVQVADSLSPYLSTIQSSATYFPSSHILPILPSPFSATIHNSVPQINYKNTPPLSTQSKKLVDEFLHVYICIVCLSVMEWGCLGECCICIPRLDASLHAFPLPFSLGRYLALNLYLVVGRTLKSRTSVLDVGKRSCTLYVVEYVDIPLSTRSLTHIPYPCPISLPVSTFLFYFSFACV